MSSKTDTEWRKFDLTTDELDRFTKAFKSEKFRSLFIEYCQEISDPENRRIYEEELKQFEAERGVDVTFVNPEPGFVIKSIANGNQKIFINVAKCDCIEKPTSQCGFDAKTGEKGLHWSLPYVQSKPKHDFDKNKVICAVFDIIFHSDTLHLAKKNPAFRKLVIETAYDAVRTTFDLTLDSIQNLKFPKLTYKGTPTPVVIRKKSTAEKSVEDCGKSFVGIKNGQQNSSDDELQPKRKEAKPKHVAAIDEYITPKYDIIHRRNVELHEFTEELDAKLNITLPKELIIKIHLPLLNSSKDVVLDVNIKSIYMNCDTPAKYKLNVNLPFDVDKEMGQARFDNQTKILSITLPVLTRKQLGILDLCREDSGVESDHHSPKEDNSLILDDDVFTDDSNHYSTDIQLTPCIKESAKPKKEKVEEDSFLQSQIIYSLPHFTYNRFENVVAFTLHVKNVESNSIVSIHTSNSYRIKFSTVSHGYFNNYYAFYFGMPEGMAAISESPRVETWDNNIVIQIELDSIDKFTSYYVGLNANDCKSFDCNEKKSHKKSHEDKTNYFEVDTTIANDELQIEITNKNFKSKIATDENEDVVKVPNHQRPKSKKSKRENKKARSFSESHCDVLKETEESKKEISAGVNNGKAYPQHTMKSRTQSESSNDEHHMDLIPLKSILKRHSSYDRTPDCSLDEHSGCAGSIDLGIGSFKSIPEEKDTEHSESVKKTVRFDKQLCRKLLFRINSTIIGQRKPKENKRKKKKRNQERRYSEGEASDYENNLQSGTCNNRCQKPTASTPMEVHKNKDTDNKTNLIFDIEI